MYTIYNYISLTAAPGVIFHVGNYRSNPDMFAAGLDRKKNINDQQGLLYVHVLYIWVFPKIGVPPNHPF